MPHDLTPEERDLLVAVLRSERDRLERLALAALPSALSLSQDDTSSRKFAAQGATCARLAELLEHGRLSIRGR